LTEFSLKKKEKKRKEGSDTQGENTSVINIYISFCILLSEVPYLDSA
jgi:hypothetical protein